MGSAGDARVICRSGMMAPVEVFEVFAQGKPGAPFTHCGNVLAPDVALAADYARNHFARRDEAERLWVIPRTAISEVADRDLLRPPGDHRFRTAEYYRGVVEKRKRVADRLRNESSP